MSRIERSLLKNELPVHSGVFDLILLEHVLLSGFWAALVVAIVLVASNSAQGSLSELRKQHIINIIKRLA